MKIEIELEEVEKMKLKIKKLERLNNIADNDFRDYQFFVNFFFRDKRESQKQMNLNLIVLNQKLTLLIKMTRQLYYNNVQDDDSLILISGEVKYKTVEYVMGMLQNALKNIEEINDNYYCEGFYENHLKNLEKEN